MRPSRLPLAFVALAGACAPADETDATNPPEPPPVALEPESGFLEIDAALAPDERGRRLWYLFQPADDAPTNKPLVLLVNGGPGYPTSLGLYSHGTARLTVEQSSDGRPVLVDNPARWTRFANLLYVDEPLSGFSYDLLRGDGTVYEDSGFDAIEDAVDFIQALLAFFVRHPELRSSPVVLAGASYGGMRVSLMLERLLQCTTELRSACGTLADELQAHFDAAWPERAGTPTSPAEAAEQFGHQVLLQPWVLGLLQYDYQAERLDTDPLFQDVTDRDPYDVSRPAGWSEALDAEALAALAMPEPLTAYLQAEPRNVAGLGPADRAQAHRVASDEYLPAATAAANQALVESLGALPNGDDYYYCPLLPNRSDGMPPFLSGVAADAANAFLDNLFRVRTFITHARYDSVVISAVIPEILRDAAGAEVVEDTEPRAGVTRPGWLHIRMPASAEAPERTTVVRFPPYAESGHLIEVTEPAALAEDVEVWLDEPVP